MLLGIDLATLILTAGYAGIFAIVFAESGLLIGFFLPGDSLLFTAGFLASQGYFNIWILIVGCFIAAVLGDNVGYAFGRRVGPRIFRRETSLLFNPRNLERARRFCVNVLASDQRDLCGRFAARGTDRFSGLSYRMSANGSPVLAEGR